MPIDTDIPNKCVGLNSMGSVTLRYRMEGGVLPIERTCAMGSV